MPITRSASLRVAHARACVNATKTTIESLRACTCTPSYYTVHRDVSGRPVKGARVKDRRVAERSLRKLLVAIDEGRVGVGRKARDTWTFRAWADAYLEILARDRGVKGSTIRAYKGTLFYALDSFGALELSTIGATEIRGFVRAIRDADASDATLHKHLRHLGAIFRAAEEDGHIDRNPLTRKFVRDLRLRVPKGDEPYTDLELARLWAQMAKEKLEPVYVMVCKVAVATGARRGELIAASWDDVDLTNHVLHLRHHYDAVDGLVTPKDREARTINLIPPAVALLEAWTAAQGVRPGGSPLFTAPRSGGRLNGRYLTKLVAKAIDDAMLPMVGEGGRTRKPFHAFRSTFARICLERGRQLQWVQAQLGHSDLNLTIGVYGAWSASAMRDEADALETEGLPV